MKSNEFMNTCHNLFIYLMAIDFNNLRCPILNFCDPAKIAIKIKVKTVLAHNIHLYPESPIK